MWCAWVWCVFETLGRHLRRETETKTGTMRNWSITISICKSDGKWAPGTRIDCFAGDIVRDVRRETRDSCRLSRLLWLIVHYIHTAQIRIIRYIMMFRTKFLHPLHGAMCVSARVLYRGSSAVIIIITNVWRFWLSTSAVFAMQRCTVKPADTEPAEQNVFYWQFCG